MSDAAQPTVAEVRAAAEAVKAAIDRHLEAVESRSGENDPAVFAAYEALAAAADAYDEILYDAYDEVTPFEVPGDESAAAYLGPDEPEAVSVLIRRDYVIADPDRLRAQATRLDSGLAAPGAPGTARPAVGSLNAAIGVLFGEYEPDEIASRCEEFGLEEGDSTLWVSAAEPGEPGEWLPEPFDDADPQLLICRFDVSEVFDDELEALDPER
ncbi:hypothetical protein [Peterkaempfera bronchialis]|uniref:Uncharacterized protein n=1 Tax=Peterkaempfera bronchialis TaxID=2126346 RepID=A0A345T3P5_9ACTN|nr:hypothetical protein [Peterkaempfera bronchialis]AXI80600.1 hypothetical protein C7M71_027635 [Peterkaempfera bronchialis]